MQNVSQDKLKVHPGYYPIKMLKDTPARVTNYLVKLYAST